MCLLFASCEQSLFQVLTHNDVGYWSKRWTPSNPNVIFEGYSVVYSKKDSLQKLFPDNIHCIGSPNLSLGDIYGIKFRIRKDTIFHYVEKKNDFILMYDTIIVESYSKNSITLRNGVVLHRIPNRFIKKILRRCDVCKDFRTY